MKRKQIFKILGGIIVIVTLVIVGFSGYSYYQYKYSLIPKNKPFTQSAHYINPDESLLNDNFKVCNENWILQYYNTQELPYPNGKNGFRNYINTNYVNRNYTDSGYLNIRFIINCEGQPGRFIIHENDLNLEPKVFDEDLKNQLFKLTSEIKYWKPIFLRGENRDSYMYVSYRIEYGKIIEIIP